MGGLNRVGGISKIIVSFFSIRIQFNNRKALFIVILNPVADQVEQYNHETSNATDLTAHRVMCVCNIIN